MRSIIPSRPGRQENLAYRAGSEVVFLNILGNKEKIRKPRVRRSGREIQLDSYSALRHDGDTGEVIFKLMVSGFQSQIDFYRFNKIDSDSIFWNGLNLKIRLKTN